uniref:Putative secreted protein n=1 Tax=Anopheles darlingi TaxID=43151 RepID=A0A2M4DMT4_ANODA
MFAHSIVFRLACVGLLGFVSFRPFCVDSSPGCCCCTARVGTRLGQPADFSWSKVLLALEAGTVEVSLSGSFRHSSSIASTF